MSKFVFLKSLRELLTPLKRLIDRKAENVNWNENDPSSPSYIAGRTHYKENKEFTLLKGTYEFDSNGIVFGNCSSFLEGKKTYKILWDGVPYECEAYSGGDGSFCIGNQEYAEILLDWEFPYSVESNEPFFIATNKEWGEFLVMAVEGKHSFQILGNKIIVHKISSEYLPESPELAPVATSGSYWDLTDTPTIYNDVLRYGEQNLALEQKTVAQKNIGLDVINYNKLQNIPISDVSYEELTINNLIQEFNVKFDPNFIFEDTDYECSLSIERTSGGFYTYPSTSLEFKSQSNPDGSKDYSWGTGGGPGAGFILNISNKLNSMSIVQYTSIFKNVSITFKKVAKSNIKQLDEKYIPDSIARKTDIPILPETTNSHMQLVTNATGEKKWEERTHYLEEHSVTNIAETTGTGKYISYQVIYGLKADKEYTVLLDGVEYKSIAKDLGLDVFLGNLRLMSASYEDTGEPFLFCGSKTDGIYVNYGAIFSENTTHTFSVTGPTDIATPLSDKFIPSNVPKVIFGEVGEVAIITEVQGSRPKTWSTVKLPQKISDLENDSNFALQSEIPDVSEFATESYVSTKVAELVNSAPETLDTLGELATALQQNGDVVNTLNEAIGNKADRSELEGLATENYVTTLYKKLNSNTVLGFYCVEDVTIITDGISKVYPANSNVEVKFIEGETFEIIPTSNNSILSLSAFPGALNTYYPWLEGVKQFSNILFDMNSEEMYTKWNQGNQGAYQVQYAQYVNCIFWSDNPYISELSKRTNYTLYYSSQLPLCYSSIPDNTFKAFYLAFGVNSDPNWGNQAYRESFAKATYATQVFSYYGARTIGIFGHDDPDFNIILPPDCRGLMSAATAIENAGTFDAINVTNFGAKSGSWRDAFGWCSSLRNLYIKNLKVNLNVSWSPIEYDSIYFIISSAANTNAITISVSPYTYNLLSSSDFELAASKNIAIDLITTNYVEDKRLTAVGDKIKNNATLVNSEDLHTVLSEAKLYTDEKIANLNTDEIEYTSLILKSSTEGSNKRFKITIDDSGVLTATEIE